MLLRRLFLFAAPIVVLSLSLTACGESGRPAVDGAEEGLSVDSVESTMETMHGLFAAVRGVVSAGKQLPSSTGKRFFIALFVGDGPEGRLQLAAGDEGHIALSEIELLRSPFDPDLLSREEATQTLQAVLDSGEGAAGLSDEQVDSICSYLGPVIPARMFGGPLDGIVLAYDRAIADKGERAILAVNTRGEVAALEFSKLAENGVNLPAEGPIVCADYQPFETLAGAFTAQPR